MATYRLEKTCYAASANQIFFLCVMEDRYDSDFNRACYAVPND